MNVSQALPPLSLNNNNRKNIPQELNSEDEQKEVNLQIRNLNWFTLAEFDIEIGGRS
jgi:hypothetical protein